MRLVVKVGTSLIAPGGRIDTVRMRALVDQLDLAHHEYLIVTSGAIASGMSNIGLSELPASVPLMQACAAVGQSALMHTYERLFFLILVVSAPWAISQQEQGVVPAFNAGPPAKGTRLPPILGKEQLWGENAQSPYQTHAYELAAKIPKVIYQQPCYCYCDRGMGHNSLHSCFSGTHGAQCGTCLKELYYTYTMHKQGKTARQIRAGIIKGDWKLVDLDTAASIN